jgi:hypothetical protein
MARLIELTRSSTSTPGAGAEPGPSVLGVGVWRVDPRESFPGVATDLTSGAARAGIHAWLVVDRTRFGLVPAGGLPGAASPGSNAIDVELSLRAIRGSR